MEMGMEGQGGGAIMGMVVVEGEIGMRRIWCSFRTRAPSGTIGAIGTTRRLRRKTPPLSSGAP